MTITGNFDGQQSSGALAAQSPVRGYLVHGHNIHRESANCRLANYGWGLCLPDNITKSRVQRGSPIFIIWVMVAFVIDMLAFVKRLP